MLRKEKSAKSLSKRLTLSALVAAGTIGTIGAIRTAQHPIIHADDINTTVQTNDQATDTSTGSIGNTDNTGSNTVSAENDITPTTTTAEPTANVQSTQQSPNISTNNNNNNTNVQGASQGNTFNTTTGTTIQSTDQTTNNSQVQQAMTPKVLPKPAAPQAAPSLSSVNYGNFGRYLHINNQLYEAQPATNWGSILQPGSHEPEHLILGAKAKGSGGSGGGMPSKIYAWGYKGAPVHRGMATWYLHDVEKAKANGKNYTAFCDGWNQNGPGSGSTYVSVGTPPVRQEKALVYANEHGYSHDIEDLICWLDSSEPGEDVQLNLVNYGVPERDMKEAHKSLDDSGSTSLSGWQFGLYKAKEDGSARQELTVMSHGGTPKTQPSTVTTPGTKSTPGTKTTPKTTNNNNNNNSSSGGGGSSSSGGGSSSSTGGSPSGNGNQQQGGNGNGTNDGGNGTEGNGNGNNGGGNGSPSNNPNNGNNSNNGQPNNSNPNNDNPNNVIVPSTDGGHTNNNNNIVPNGPVINNNDYILPNGLNGNGDDNKDAAEILSALVNNEDRDNQNGLNRFEQDMQQAEDNSIDQSKTQASESAAQVLIDEKGKNAEQIESMNASAQVQSITNSMNEDSYMNSMSAVAKSEQNSYMDYLKEAEADANSTAADTLADLKRQSNLTPAQRRQFYIAIQANEDNFIANAASHNAYQDGAITTLNVAMNHLQAEIQHPDDIPSNSTDTNGNNVPASTYNDDTSQISQGSKQESENTSPASWLTPNANTTNTNLGWPTGQQGLVNGRDLSLNMFNAGANEDNPSFIPGSIVSADNDSVNPSNLPNKLNKPSHKMKRTLLCTHAYHRSTKNATHLLHNDSDIQPSDDSLFPITNNKGTLHNNSHNIYVTSDVPHSQGKNNILNHGHSFYGKANQLSPKRSQFMRLNNMFGHRINASNQSTGTELMSTKEPLANAEASSTLIPRLAHQNILRPTISTDSLAQINSVRHPNNSIIQKHHINTNTISSSRDKNTAYKSPNNRTLPRTGEQTNSMGIASMAIVLGMIGMLGASKARKHKFN